MTQYKLWVRINQLQTTFTRVYASYDSDAKALGEAQFGVGNVLGYWRIAD